MSRIPTRSDIRKTIPKISASPPDAVLPVTALLPHPRNAAIYGDGADAAFAAELRASGWIKPLVVTPAGNGAPDLYRIVSGHRRWRAARANGVREVPYEVRTFDSEQAELEALLLENAFREKTTEQRVREAEVWDEIERDKARTRMAAAGASAAPGRPSERDKTKEQMVREGEAREKIERKHAKARMEPALPEKGTDPGSVPLPRPRNEAADAVAARAGLGSGRTYERARKVVTAIDAASPSEARALRKVLEREGAKPAARLLRLEPEARGKALEILADSDTTAKQAVAAAKRSAIMDRAAADVAAAPTPGKIADLDAATGRYRCVYLDPPWAYRDAGCRGAAAQHYPTMSIEEIEALPVGRLLHTDGAHVWCWTTWPKIREGHAHRVMRAWGFESWTSEIVWDKDSFPAGHYVRVQTEVLLLATTSPSFPLLRRDVRGLHRERSGAHSGKPSFFRELIETTSPGPRIELFARETAEGWDRWGLEA